MSPVGARLRIPLLVAVTLAVVVITLTSPPPPDPGAATGEPVPAAAPLPAAVKQRVPVRSAHPAGGAPRPGDRVALRQLVVAAGADDAGLATWRAVLDGIGTPYDVLVADREPLTPGRLVGPDGVGRYNGVLLADGGGYAGALDPAEWEALWAYERAYGIRQVALNARPGAFPEDHCLRDGPAGEVGAEPVRLALTPAGTGVFDHLRPEAVVPLTATHLLRAGLAPGCAAEPVLSAPDGVAGVVSRSPDGRERLALTFAAGPDTAATALLGYGLVRWATRGVLLGEQRHWFTVDVDDWFNATTRRRAGGEVELFRLGDRDAVAARDRQRALRARYPVAAGFTLTLPYNGGLFRTGAPATCAGSGTPDPLSSCSKSLVGEFRWVNHTTTHPRLDDTSYEVSRDEIRRNLDIAARGGLPVPPEVLKTPEYSGLGVRNPDPRSTAPPTDVGLAGSNRAMLDAAHDLGVRYVQGNMSFAGHRPGCFNCGTRHPLRPELLVVPDWPTAVAFEATEPEEQVALRAAAAPGRDQSYGQFVDSEADVALRHVMAGSAYAHTLHQGNLREYAPGRSLAFDWVEAVVAGYAALYRVPLEGPDWRALARYVEDRTEHFAELAAGRDAVWDRATGEVAYTADGDRALLLTGVETRPAGDADRSSADEAETYGSDEVSRLGLTRGGRVVLRASPRP
ncbi:polysaccharide deacetylase family protein [Saccharothrix syringae]|nr:polysaccharide deacetylase family protein [Saccharothrix syringae]